MLSQKGETGESRSMRLFLERDERVRERIAPTIALQDAAHYRARRATTLCKRRYRVVQACDGFCIATLFSGHQFLENSHVTCALSFSQCTRPVDVGCERITEDFSRED